MSDLLDDEIRFLVSEIVNAAPATIEPPASITDDADGANPSDKSDGDRWQGRFVVLAALIAVMSGVAGLFVFGSDGDQPVITDTPTSTTVPEAGVDEDVSDESVGSPEFLSLIHI